MITPVIQIPLGGPDDLLLFAWTDRFGRSTKQLTTPGLDLDKNQGSSIFNDQVNFTYRGPQIALNDLHPLALEERCRSVLTTTTQCQPCFCHVDTQCSLTPAKERR